MSGIGQDCSLVQFGYIQHLFYRQLQKGFERNKIELMNAYLVKRAKSFFSLFLSRWITNRKQMNQDQMAEKRQI